MGWRRSRRVAEQTEARIRSAMLSEDGTVEARFEAPRVVATLYASLCLLLHDAPNYSEATMTIRPKRTREPFVVTVQRHNGETPHTMRIRAEARAAELVAVLTEAHGILEDGSQHDTAGRAWEVLDAALHGAADAASKPTYPTGGEA